MNSNLFLTCFFTYLIGVILFGWWMTRKKQSGEDFLLGGRALPFFLTLGTTVATMVGTGSSMGAVGKAYENGWFGSLFCVGGAAGIFLAAWLFAPVREFRFMTMAEEISSYVGANRTVRNLLSVFIYLASVGWLGAHILGGGKYLQFVAEVSPVQAKLWIAVGFGVYTIIGGYTAVVWTDSLQAIVLFVGFVITAVFALRSIGGWDQLQAIHTQLAASNLETGWLPSLSLVVVIAVGVLGTPSFRQRIYSGRTIREIRRAFLTSGLLYLAFASLPAIIGMAAFAKNPNLVTADHAFPYIATEVLPTAMGILILLAGLSATMSSASSDAVAAVTTVIGDIWVAIYRRPPPAERVVFWSRIALVITTGLALAMALTADSIVGYIKNMVALFITGMCVAGVCGRLWPRYNWLGALASLSSATATAVVISANPTWNSYWGNPVIPSLLVSVPAGIVASLASKPDQLSQPEAVQWLQRNRDGS